MGKQSRLKGKPEDGINRGVTPWPKKKSTKPKKSISEKLKKSAKPSASTLSENKDELLRFEIAAHGETLMLLACLYMEICHGLYEHTARPLLYRESWLLSEVEARLNCYHKFARTGMQ